MSVDTRDKRFSMIGFGTPWRRQMQNPIGSIDAPARAELLCLYYGITPAKVTIMRRTLFGEAGTRRQLPTSNW